LLPRLVDSFRTFCAAINRNQKSIKMLLPFQVIDFILQKMPGRLGEFSDYFK
jgi:hypothetical protein